MVRRLRLETFLRGVSALALVVCGAALLYATPTSEPVGCANNTCLQIVYWWDCKKLAGTAYDNPDCIYCFGPAQRCDSGSVTTNCKENTAQPLSSAAANVKNVCYCPPSPGVPAGTLTVQATGVATEKFKSAGVNQFICK
jgi:hypothetical protein